MTKLRKFPLFLLLLLGFAVPVEASEKILQSLEDPSIPKQGWLMSETAVRFAPRLEAPDEAELAFDIDAFERFSGVKTPAGTPYRFRKIRVGPKDKPGSLYVLLEIGAGDDRKMYLAKTETYGRSWKITKVAVKKPPKLAPTPTPTPAPNPTSQDGAVDLNNLDLGTASTASTEGASANPHGGGGGAPVFKALFDVLLYQMPGRQVLTFDSFHSFFLIDYIPKPEVQFSFDLQGRYFELALEPTETTQFRVGKIWIPFDDLNPHNTFGGFMNTSRLAPANGLPFLPDIWTDFGVGGKYIMEGDEFTMEVDAYLVNGFGAQTVSGGAYPAFGTSGGIDNNADKALGGRVKFKFGEAITAGGSVYTCRYSNEGTEDLRLVLYGFDAQYRPSNELQFKFGYLGGNVQLPDGSEPQSFNRLGLYGEVKNTFNSKKGWFGAVRAGQLQPDDRVPTASDVLIGGFRAGIEKPWYQLYFQYHHDFQKSDKKSNYDYTALRLVLMF